MKKIFFNWAPPLIWMGIIFYLSSRQDVSVTQTPLFNFLILKTLHMMGYAVLYFLIFRANRNLRSAFVIAILYAASDEIHQTFVPTRGGGLRDVLIDTVGIFLMYSYIRSHMGFVRKYLWRD